MHFVAFSSVVYVAGVIELVPGSGCLPSKLTETVVTVRDYNGSWFIQVVCT